MDKIMVFPTMGTLINDADFRREFMANTEPETWYRDTENQCAIYVYMSRVYKRMNIYMPRPDTPVYLKPLVDEKFDTEYERIKSEIIDTAKKTATTYDLYVAHYGGQNCSHVGASYAQSSVIFDERYYDET